MSEPTVQRGGGLRDAFAYELVRIRTIRSTWWLTGLAVVLGVVISTLLAWGFGHDFGTHGVQEDDLDGLGPVIVTQLGATGQVPSIVAYLMAMIGVFAWGHEYRHGMIRASLTALRSRTSFWFAKYVVCALWAALTSLVTMLLAGVLATPFLHQYLTVFSGQTWEFIGRTEIYVVVLVWLGMAFTAATRSQAFALVALFLWPLLIEPLVQLFFHLVPGVRDHAEVTRFLPFTAGRRLLDALVSGDSTFGHPMDALGGLIIFGGVAAALMIASYLLFQRRDA
jgi:ABC-type transport system involved in multi-copper enzyme maturation permease subunit